MHKVDESYRRSYKERSYDLVVEILKKIIILGTGGNCIDILDTIDRINSTIEKKRYDCMGFLDDNENNLGKEIHGHKVLGPLNIAPTFEDAYFVNGIGSPETFIRKEEIISKTKLPLERFETIIHPSVSLSGMCKIGSGTVILSNVSVATDVVIGNHVIILSNSVINHDDEIGDYTCIATGVNVSGGVKVGKSCYLGAGSSIISNVSIGSGSLIGLGSAVLRDVPANTVVAGNPARFLGYTDR